MKRLLSDIVIVLLLCGTGYPVLAVNAYPGTIRVKLPDGTILRMRVHGDEYFNYRTTEDGYLIAQHRDGFYYYSDWSREEGIRLTGVRAHNPGERTAAEQAVLLMRSKAVPAMVQARAQSLRQEAFRVMRISGVQARGFPMTGSPKSLVLLADYRDIHCVYDQSMFEDMLNSPGYSENGATGSARDYYSDNSGGRFTPRFVVYGPVQLPRTMAYYGGGDGREAEMIVDACRAAENAGLDFRQFDEDGDGVIDNVFVFYAGYNKAEGGPEESIWPHRSYVGGNHTFSGVKLFGYACSSELKGHAGQRMASIGTLCHEFAHVLGLPDLYDTDGGTDGNGYGVYQYSLMGSGNYNNESRTPPYLNVVERSLVGWLEPGMLSEKGDYSLEAVGKNKGYYYTTDSEGEIFVLENRQPEKWDAPLPGHGLLIYHVDRSQNVVGELTARDRWDLRYNSVNNVASHPCMRICQADGSGGVDGNGSGIFFPGTTGKTEFTADGVPSARSWSGMDLRKDIKGIRETGSVVHFTYEGRPDVPVEGVRIEPAELSLNLMDSLQLTAVFVPEGALNRNCDWYSSNRNVLSVNEKGVIRALKMGEAEITVITKEGGFQAQCKVTVTQNLSENETLRVGQRDLWLSWEADKPVDKWKVNWKKTTSAEYVSTEAGNGICRISGLQPGAGYKIQLVAAGDKDTEMVIWEKEVVTEKITAPVAVIGGVKGSYTAGEALFPVLKNVQSDVTAEEWWLNGESISIDRGLQLAAGKYEVRVDFKGKTGLSETIVRKITVSGK